jgi:hypothetical protein
LFIKSGYFWPTKFLKMDTKYLLFGLFLFVLLENSHAQNAFISTNLGNLTYGRRDEIMIGFKMRHKKMLTVCVERWHSEVREGADFFSVEHLNYGGRLQIGTYNCFSLKKHPKLQYFERFFGVLGQHWIENQNFRATFDAFGNVTGFAPGIKTIEKLRMAGVGLEIGLVYKYRQFFVGPSMITGYMIYINEGNGFENVYDRDDRLQKGLRIYFPMMRFVVGFYFK